MIDLTGKPAWNPDIRFVKRKKAATLTAIISGSGCIRRHLGGLDD
jgi:hypothetical protein